MKKFIILCAFIGEKDIALVAEGGFNSIRLPFNWRIFNEESKAYIDGFEKIDTVVAWCKKYKLYLILDLHAAPGGQNSYFISDPESKKLWSSNDNMEQTYRLWKEIARRYTGNTTIAGYDVLNEPKINNTKVLTSFYKKLIDSIRSVDEHHLLIIEGNKLTRDFKDFPEKFDNNQV